MPTKLEIISANLTEDIELEAPETVDDKALLIGAIKERVAYMLAREPGLLFSYMYRLDVEESQVGAIVSGVHRGDPEEELAKLIYQRQLRRVESKERYKQEPIEGWQW